MNIVDLFFELTQVALGSRDHLSHTPTSDEWKAVYEMAKKQSLVGICFAGVQKIISNPLQKGQTVESSESKEPVEISTLTRNLPETEYLRWMGMAAKIQQCNSIINQRCAELQKYLATEGFKSCILKGQGLATLYGDELGMLR